MAQGPGELSQGHKIRLEGMQVFDTNPPTCRSDHRAQQAAGDQLIGHLLLDPELTCGFINGKPAVGLLAVSEQPGFHLYEVQ